MAPTNCKCNMLLALLVVVLSGKSTAQEPLELVILHTNDVSARVEEFNSRALPCSDSDSRDGKCFGGVARRATVIKEIREEYGADNVILLDAGDQWQGTPWFYYYSGMEAAHFMNLLGYDAMALGQHEFDFGAPALQKFFRNLTFPVVCSNLDSSAENETVIRDLYVPYTLLDVGKEGHKQKVAIVGFAYAHVINIVTPKGNENLKLLDEATEMQKAIDEVMEQGINKIIGLGSMDLIEAEVLVTKLRDLDVLVCADRTKIFLYTGDPPGTEEPYGTYPYVVNVTQDNVTFTQVPIVQAYEYGKYLGFFKVNFDDKGDVTGWEGNPILLNASVAEDMETMEDVMQWKIALDNFTGEVLGNTRQLLNGDRFSCRRKECSFGNLLTDAMLQLYIKDSLEIPGSWTDISIALWNAGGIRASAGPGDIHYSELLDAFPYQNTIAVTHLKGKLIREMLEHSVVEYEVGTSYGGPGRFLQMSGVKVEYDVSKPPGSRVQKARVRCSACMIPTYEELDDEVVYGILTSTFMLHGGDGYTMLRDTIPESKEIGLMERDMVADFMRQRSPVVATLEGRIIFCEDGKCTREAADSTC